MFTKLIHDRGYTVKEACEVWGIRYDVWRRKCRNPKLTNQLLSMCKGLEKYPLSFNDGDITYKSDAWDNVKAAGKLMDEAPVPEDDWQFRLHDNVKEVKE